KLACEKGGPALAESAECEDFADGAATDACSMVRSLSEKALDIQRELAHQRKLLSYQPEDYDAAQLEWLRSGLDESIRDRPQAWRVVFMHHPLWTTIRNHAESAETRAVRSNLLSLLRDCVHLILSGHAH